MENCPKTNKRCPEFSKKLGCHAVNHHIYWPRSAYQTPLEQEFRELEDNLILMCKADEIYLHQTAPPPKPSIEVMEHCVQAERLRREDLRLMTPGEMLMMGIKWKKNQQI